MAEARERGTLIHALLEHLPRVEPDRREDAALRYVRARAPKMPRPKREGLVEAVLRLMGEPGLAPLFGLQARAEVALAGSVMVGGVERRVSGRIDRLAVTDEAVWLCDFKTGRPPAPGAPPPEGEIAQIALYAALLERIYPGRPVRPWLVWTVGPTLRRLDRDEIGAALDGLSKAA